MYAWSTVGAWQGNSEMLVGLDNIINIRTPGDDSTKNQPTEKALLTMKSINPLEKLWEFGKQVPQLIRTP